MGNHSHALDALDTLIASRSITRHPFYVAWNEGRLTREQLACYAESYYPHVEAFPGYLEIALNAADDPQIRRELDLNLYEERSVPKAHPVLWLDFAAGLGLDRSQVASAPIRPAARRIVETFEQLAAAGSAQALACLYAYESQQPEVARLKANGLRHLYGITDPAALAYFEVHAEADLRHRDGERRAMQIALHNGSSQDQLLQAAGEALDAYWGLLDGVCTETGIIHEAHTSN